MTADAVTIENRFITTTNTVIYAILAAGSGSRLKSEGVDTPKPLLTLGENTLLGRLIALLSSRPDCTHIYVVVNRSTARAMHASETMHGDNDRLTVTVRDTDNPLESLRTLTPLISDGADSSMCIMNVDSVWTADEFDGYISAFKSERNTIDALMAVTEYVDDENPLWVATDTDRRITGFFDLPPADVALSVSGGIYILPVKAASDILDECLAKGRSRLRDFQRALLASGMTLKAYPFSKIIDIDHTGDLDEARRLIGLTPGSLH